MVSVVKKLLPGAAGTAGTGGGDDDFNLVTGLYHFDGSNGAQNKTFLDSSSNAFSVTRAGSSTQGTFSPFSKDEGKWSIEFPVGNTNTKLTLSNVTNNFALGTSAFTLECWVFVTADTNSYSRVFHIGPYWNDNNAIGLVVNDTASSDKIAFCVYAAGGRTCVSTNATPMNQWTHIACVRDSSGNFKLFINGNLDATNTSYTSTNISPSGNQTLAIGSVFETSSNIQTDASFEGFISNLRFVVGTALYSSSFTPSTSPLTDVTNTNLLTCCSNRFRDKSTSAHPITAIPTGASPKVKPFSPFKPSAAYDSAVNGGSFYGDGSGDYASIAASSDFDVLSNGTFTIDFWFYRITSFGTYADYVGIFNGVSAGVLLYQYSTGFHVYINGTTVFNVTHPAINQWVHVALTRDGTTLRLFLNGVLQASSNASLGTSNYPLNIAGDSTGRAGVQGYVSDVRVVKGTAVYTSAFTPPTAPSTAITYTEALLSFTNGAMFDQSGTTNAITRANTQLDTSVKKFGTASAEFDGTSDNLHLVNVVPIGTSPFTIEFFFRSNTTSLDTYYRRMYKMASVTGQSNEWCEICINHSSGSYGSGNNIFVYVPDTNGRIIGTATPFDNNWHHFALTRDTSNNLKMFVDGTQDGSTATNAGNFSQTEHLVGANDTSGNGDFLGYIDELRLTMKARYTSNFTAPTTAFPDI